MMKDYTTIEQHIKDVLEERGLDDSLSLLFNNHKNISFKFWRLVSFVTLLPVCIQNAINSKSIIYTLIGYGPHTSDFLLPYLLISFAIFSFVTPIVLSSVFLTLYLPLYKLSQKSFFKKYFAKYLRQFPVLASSCDTMIYKEDFVLKYSHDVNFNLAMSSYYDFLLQKKSGLEFGKEWNLSFALRKENLLDMQLNPEKYQKNFFSIVITFINDFQYISKSPLVLKQQYQQILDDYSQDSFSPTESNQDNNLPDNVETPKKKFKEML